MQERRLRLERLLPVLRRGSPEPAQPSPAPTTQAPRPYTKAAAPLPSLRQVASRISKLACVDTFADCQAWARTGECERNPGLMRERCCNACSDIDRFGKDTCPAEADPAACEVRVKQGQCISNPRAIADECCRSCLDWQDGTMHCADTAPTQCARWAAEGECHANPGFMTQSCCGTCTHPCCADPNCVPPPQ